MARKKDFMSKLPTAKGSEGGVHWAKDHHFKIQILKVVSKDGRDDDYFIIEGKVLESDCDKQGPGFCASQVIGESADMAPGNVADFLRASWAVYSRDPENGLDELDPNNDEDWEDIEDMYEAAAGEDNLLMDTIVYLKTKGIITKEKKNPFTVHKWSADRPDSWGDEEVEEDE